MNNTNACTYKLKIVGCPKMLGVGMIGNINLLIYLIHFLKGSNHLVDHSILLILTLLCFFFLWR